MNYSNGTGCLELIITMVLIVILAIFGLGLKYYKCTTKAEKQGYECSWGPIQGCMVKQKDGSWIDYDRLRIMD